MNNPFTEGYYAGLVDDAGNPHAMLSLDWFPWLCGNTIGREVHRATVDAVYLNSAFD